MYAEADEERQENEREEADEIEEQEESVEEAEAEALDGTTMLRVVDDPKLIEKLEKEPTTTMYRSMALINGKLYPPMSSMLDGKLREPVEIGVWEQAEESPDKAYELNGKWYFTLTKDNGKPVRKVAYNPYLHLAAGMLNDQFSEAQDRPNLVTVSMEVPTSELNGAYKADKAHDPTGLKSSWKGGPITAKLTGTRGVYLTRYGKVTGIVDNKDVAKNIADTIGDRFEVLPTNVFSPAVREELEALGYKFVETNNTGKLVEGENAGKTWASVYGSKVEKPKKSKKSKKSEGTTLFSVKDLTSEEQAIVAEAKANGTYMLAPNGKATNLTEKQWAQVRTKAFKKWFGDWEKALRVEKLRKSKTVVITGDEVEHSDDIKQYRKNADQYAKTLRGKYTNKDTGIEIELTSSRNNGGIREILQHDYKDVWHLQSVAAIPQIIENSIYIASEKNEDTKIDTESFDYYVCGLKIGNEDYTVKSVIATLPNGARYYDHKLTTVEKGKLIDLINKIPNHVSNPISSESSTESGNYYVGKDTRLISILQTNASKIVDENGEPMVVYHDTSSTIYRNIETGEIWDELDWRAKQEWEERDDWDDYWQEEDFYIFDNKFGRRSAEMPAFFFTPNYDEYHEYGERTIAAFLNIRNPKFDPDIKDSGLTYTAGEDAMNELISQGYDGFIRTEDGQWYETNAFHPNQIKSATDNVGTFDEGNEDIRFSVKTPQRLNKYATEEIFGGIWIRNKEEYAKFASAVETYGIEEDGEGVTFTDNFFYAYYWNIDGNPIPYASVYMNRDESQDIVNQAQKEIANVRTGERAKFYFDRAVARFRDFQAKDDANNGNSNGIQNTRRTAKLVRGLLRKGRYYDRPDLYVKTERFGRGDRQDTGISFRTVYHGSGAEFEKFDHSFMGSGEGNQAFGWGTYVSEVDGIAKMYASTHPMATGLERSRLESERNRLIEAIPFRKGDALEESQRKLSEIERELASLPEAGRHLYTVEIPDDNGENYLYWEKETAPAIRRKVYKKLYDILAEGDYKGAEKELKRELDDLAKAEVTDETLYGNVSAYLGGDKYASEFFHDLGFVGIKFPAGTIYKGDYHGANNYVIFNEDDLEIVEHTRFRVANENQEIFVSNAARAVEGIKQEKATPQQWLAMIQSKGGLKAGEDKWMGLSDWLKESDKKTLTKQEVLDFIGENKIWIEEVKYGGGYKYLRAPDEGDYDFTPEADEEIEHRYGDIGEFDYWPHETFEFIGDANSRFMSARTANKKAKFVNENNFDFDFEEDVDEFIREIETHLMNDIDSWIETKGDRDINSTRLEYTTEGLVNKREIALTVPTIESWNEDDDIHFGDAGQGRAVAWIRFGETEDADNKKTLVIDEIQSKRHQEGREKGYAPKKTVTKDMLREARAKENQMRTALEEKYGKPFDGELPVSERVEARRQWMANLS